MNNCPLRLLENKIAVRIRSKTNITSAGVIIPDSANEFAQDRGTVASIGPEVEDVEVGDIVIFSPFSINAIEYRGVVYTVIREVEVICIVPDFDDKKLTILN